MYLCQARARKELLCIQSVRGKVDGTPIVDGRGPRWRADWSLRAECVKAGSVRFMYAT